jgi:Mrp family chromosome partitioning ATPase/DUF971 family protein
MVKKEQVLEALSQIIDPDFQRDIVSLGFIKELKIEGSEVSFSIELTTPACPLKPVFEEQAKSLVGGLDGVESVQVKMTARKTTKRRIAVEESGLKKVGQILAVSSCKGGVGKSTMAAMLARTLVQQGLSIGLLDADIYGPSIPTLFRSHEMGVEGTPDRKLRPREIDGLKLMSFGFLAGDGPAVLRGPLVAQYMQQLLHQVDWGELDILIIDMPPGTGDIQLTISQSVQLDGAVIVTTPHQLALADVRKGILMFEKVDVPVLGVLENMARFICDDCGKTHHLFGKGGAELLQERFGLDTLAEIPIVGSLEASLHTLVETPIAKEATEAVIRALGKNALQRPATPEVEFDANFITLRWPDTNEEARVPNRALRAACSCALCIDELTNAPLLDPATIPDDIHAEQVGIIGNYAVSVDWSDGHNTGFFPYSTFRRLASASS